MNIFIFLVIYFISHYSCKDSKEFKLKCHESIEYIKICHLLYERFVYGLRPIGFVSYMMTTQMIARKQLNNDIYIPKEERLALCRGLYDSYESKTFCDEVERILRENIIKDR